MSMNAAENARVPPREEFNSKVHAFPPGACFFFYGRLKIRERGGSLRDESFAGTAEEKPAMELVPNDGAQIFAARQKETRWNDKLPNLSHSRQKESRSLTRMRQQST